MNEDSDILPNFDLPIQDANDTQRSEDDDASVRVSGMAIPAGTSRYIWDGDQKNESQLKEASVAAAIASDIVDTEGILEAEEAKVSSVKAVDGNLADLQGLGPDHEVEVNDDAWSRQSELETLQRIADRAKRASQPDLVEQLRAKEPKSGWDAGQGDDASNTKDVV